eukprot:6465304-Amphidinium_carterae.2
MRSQLMRSPLLLCSTISGTHSLYKGSPAPRLTSASATERSVLKCAPPDQGPFRRFTRTVASTQAPVSDASRTACFK